ncbi:MAG: RNA polymerase factor sigma-54 [Bacteroidia bacterium]|nr:RNA polymerase factor sigma-54 [Bacteroidia bacterium]
MLNQRLSQRQVQTLSPQQIQLMKLLQIPTVALEQRIKEELEANPALDEGEEEEQTFGSETDSKTENEEESTPESEEEFELDDYLTEYLEDDPDSYKTRDESSYYSDEEDKTIPIAVHTTFHENLERQLGLLELEDERDLVIAKQLVGSIDEDGYIRRDLLSVIDDLLFAHNIETSVSELKQMLRLIQKFDPPGVGAKDLRECLLLQLKEYRDIDEDDLIDDVELRNGYLAFRIIYEYFEEFSKKHYHKLQRYLGINEAQLKDAVEIVLKLNPKPASGFNGGGNSRAAQYIVPDFTITNRDGELDLTLNTRNAPDLRVNEHYKDMLSSYKLNKKAKKVDKQQKEAIVFIKQKIDSAKWFIDAIRQRYQTMYKTMYAILQYQYDYFLSGDPKKLRPMILKDIAEITGLDISTVSRVANSKYIQTEFGTKRLKYFFSESLQTESGEQVSTLEVKNILTEIIEEENKKKPLSDESLKNLLIKKGYNIARRTVAKYREQMNIPVARLRKQL